MCNSNIILFNLCLWCNDLYQLNKKSDKLEYDYGKFTFSIPFFIIVQFLLWDDIEISKYENLVLIATLYITLHIHNVQRYID